MDAGDSDGNGFCLPYDVLLDILRRLPCRTTAQSRTTCRAWRALVDDNGLLPRFFSSRCFPGVFTNHSCCADRSYFLAAPPTSSSRGGNFQRPLFSHGWARVADHCNGLLLLHNDQIQLSAGGREENDTYVCNPATVRCDVLPRPPGRSSLYQNDDTFLAFDPAVSLHYEVYKGFRVRKVYWSTLSSEEPKVPVVRSQVFSSQTRQWKMREFEPGRCAPGRLHTLKAWACEYWRGSLYMLGQEGLLIILRCLEGTYDLVQLPGKYYTSAGTYHLPHRSIIANYDKGVHYAELNAFQLKVWALMGLGDGQLGWTMLHDANLQPHIHSMQKKSPTTQPRMEWEMARSRKSIGLFIQKDNTTDGVDDEEVEEKDTDGDAQNNDIREGNALEDGLEYYYCGIIGLHPHKDVLLLNMSGTAVAYNFATSRMQYLRHGLHREPSEQCIPLSSLLRRCAPHEKNTLPSKHP